MTLTRAQALAALSRPLDEALARRVTGRVFRNVLFPLRGGAIGERTRRGVELTAPQGSAVRAASDGLVLYTGELPRRGKTVVIAHENGWVTAYAGVEEVAVEALATVERGAWIGLVGEHGLRFELVDRGTPRDPRPLFAQVPALPGRP